MQCPKCRSNIYGKVSKCMVCGYMANTVVDAKPKEEKKNTIENAILNPKDFDDYQKKLDFFKKNKNDKEPNIIVPIIIILVIIIFIVFLALMKFIST